MSFLPKISYSFVFNFVLVIYILFLAVSESVSALDNPLIVTRSQVPVLHYLDLLQVVFITPVVEELIFRSWLSKKPTRLFLPGFSIFCIVVINQITKFFLLGGFVETFISTPLFLNSRNATALIHLFGNANVLGYLAGILQSLFYLSLVGLLFLFSKRKFTLPEQVRKIAVLGTLFTFVLWHHRTWNIWDDPLLLYLFFGYWYTQLTLRRGIKTAIFGHAFYNATITLSTSLPILWVIKDWNNLVVTMIIWFGTTAVFMKQYRKNLN